MTQMRVKGMLFTVDPATKAYVYAQAVTKAFYQSSAQLDAEVFKFPVLPKSEQPLKDTLALPSLIEVDMTGAQHPASQERWRIFIASRLLIEGIHWLNGETLLTPSLAYNEAFFTFHLEQMQTERTRSEFIGYLRDFLLAQVTTANKAREEEDGRLWLDTLTWLESYSKQLKIRRVVSKRFTLKHMTLAYKLLFEYEYIKINNQHNITQQVDYIAQKTKGGERTIERYLNSNISIRTNKSRKYFIYEEDMFDSALLYIKKIMPDASIDDFRLDRVFKCRE